MGSTHVYEVQIKVDGISCGYYCDHRFATFPDREMVVALKDEAIATFEALHGEQPFDLYASVVYLGADERKAHEEAEVAG